MEIKERIESHIEKNNGHLPWPYGIKGKASDRAHTTWNTLSQSEKLAVLKQNPFKKDRNKIIKELSNRGIPQAVLSELSGLCANVIKRVTLKNKKESNGLGGSCNCYPQPPGAL